MIISIKPVPGTSRLRTTFDTGAILERQNIYLTAAQWESLRELSAMKGISGSKMLGKLIESAMTSNSK